MSRRAGTCRGGQEGRTPSDQQHRVAAVMSPPIAAGPVDGRGTAFAPEGSSSELAYALGSSWVTGRAVTRPRVSADDPMPIAALTDVVDVRRRRRLARTPPAGSPPHRRGAFRALRCSTPARLSASRPDICLSALDRARVRLRWRSSLLAHEVAFGFDNHTKPHLLRTPQLLGKAPVCSIGRGPCGTAH